MSGEFDGLDATEKAGIEAALNRCGRLALNSAEHAAPRISAAIARSRPTFMIIRANRHQRAARRPWWILD